MSGRRQVLYLPVALLLMMVMMYAMYYKQSMMDELQQIEKLVKKSMESQKSQVIQFREAQAPGPQKSEKSSENPQSLRHFNRGIVYYSKEVTDRISALTSRKAESRDEELISFVREIIDPPSEGPLKPSRNPHRTPQVEEVEEILHQKTGGIFVECGGLDGERSSNTLYLERERKWTGLLVEMDPHYYTQLVGKSRKSWSIHACLSPYQHVTELPFHGDSGGAGRIDITENKKGQNVPCFPFESLMLALNITHVDYFSLDVEGVEFSILQTIPFDRIRIDMLSVEYGHDEKRKKETVKFMEDKGYVMYKDIHTSTPMIGLYVEDFIFVRKDIPLPATKKP